MKQIYNFPKVEEFENILDVVSVNSIWSLETIVKYKDSFYIRHWYKNNNYIQHKTKFIEIHYYLNLSLEDLKLYTNRKISYGELAEKYNKIIFEKSIYNYNTSEWIDKYYELSYEQLKFITNINFEVLCNKLNDILIYAKKSDLYNIKKYNLFENETS